MIITNMSKGERHKWTVIVTSNVGTHQELWGSQDIQVQTLDPGVVDPHFPVYARALNTDQDPQVGGQPGGTWQDRTQDGYIFT